VSFEICIIRPFNGVTLEIGGTVETYWKSTAIPFSGGTNQSHRPPAVRSLSASTSPSNRNQLNSANNSVTLSSLSGEYVHVIVQVTRDFIPVVFNGWVLPIPGFDLGVSDVTYEQFQILAKTSGKAFNTTLPIPSSAWEWHRRVSVSLISLEALLKVGLKKIASRVS
jgi:CDK inhibitor PHO81